MSFPSLSLAKDRLEQHVGHADIILLGVCCDDTNERIFRDGKHCGVFVLSSMFVVGFGNTCPHQQQSYQAGNRKADEKESK
jgi:hypothetical protein